MGDRQNHQKTINGGAVMSILIEEFKKEHTGIIETFKGVEELGIFTKEGQAKLMFLAADLLKHLWNEDEQLYSNLRKASENNEKLKEILIFFVNGIGDIHEGMLEFFTKYSKGVMDNSFQREYERLFDALNLRIWFEESILYGEYKKITQQ